MIPDFLIGRVMRWPWFGRARLKIGTRSMKLLVLWSTGSVLTTTMSPTGITITCGWKSHLTLSISGVLASFGHALPFSTAFR